MASATIGASAPAPGTNNTTAGGGATPSTSSPAIPSSSSASNNGTMQHNGDSNMHSHSLNSINTTMATGGLGSAGPSSATSLASAVAASMNSGLLGGAPMDSQQQQQQQPSPADILEATRQDLEIRLKEMIESLLELSITVYDFQSESNGLVQQKIQELVTQLATIDGFKDRMDMMVPMEVLSFIEDGKNPDLFTRSFVERVAGENQFTNGKIMAMKTFEQALQENLKLSFPEEMQEYQSIVNSYAQNDSAMMNGSEQQHHLHQHQHNQQQQQQQQHYHQQQPPPQQQQHPLPPPS